MFILSNYNKTEPFTVSEANNLSVIESNIDNLKFKATECNSPVQYFCIKSSSTGCFKKADFIKAKMFNVEIIFEKPQVEQENITSSYVNLISDFGDKRSKEAIAKKGLRRFVPSDNITFNVENQILPVFDKEAKTPFECYSLSLLFTEEVIESFESIESNITDSCLFVRTIYKEDNKLCMVILDCIHKVLMEKFIYARVLGKYQFYYDELKNDLVRNKIPSILKDKLIVKFYIVALMACNYELILDQLPRFGETVTKITMLLKMIGCTITKNGRVKLQSMPQDTFMTKKFKKN